MFLIYFFLYIPIVVLILFSFNKSKLNAVWTGFSLQWYSDLFHNYGVLTAVKNSIVVAIVTTIVSVIIGTLTAVGMYKYSFKGKSILDSMLYVPVVIPEIVMGISLLAFFSEAHIPLGIVTLIIAHITFSISYVLIVVKARIEGFDKSIEEAALDLGATPFQTFTKITLPIIMPGIVAGALLAFTLSLDDVNISFFVAGPGSTTLPLKIFSMVKFGVTPEINALSTILILFTLTIVFIAQKMKTQNLSSKTLKTLGMFALICITILSTSIFTANKIAAKQMTQLNVFNWSEYLPQSVIDKFQDKYNIKVNYSTFSSNEEMLAKIMAGGSQFDLVVASDYMVDVMVKQNLIQTINLNKIQNFKNIGNEFKNLSFDPKNKYTVPYMWGDVVIAYDSSKVKDTITSYSDLWKPEFKNSLVVLDDQRQIIGMAAKKLGYSLNETDPNILTKAKEELIRLKPNIRAYDSDSPKTMLINGEAKAGYVWGTEASLARRENKNIRIVIPKEGLSLQQDNFVLPKQAKNINGAELFINFILDPEISAEISTYFPYANPNMAAHKFISPDILNDIGVYPPKADIQRGEHLKDIGQSLKIYDNIWSELKQ
jgi:spermidine/putrescine transport system permease protein